MRYFILNNKTKFQNEIPQGLNIILFIEKQLHYFIDSVYADRVKDRGKTLIKVVT